MQNSVETSRTYLSSVFCRNYDVILRATAPNSPRPSCCRVNLILPVFITLQSVEQWDHAMSVVRVCPSVCLSVRPGCARANFAKYSTHDGHGRGSVLIQRRSDTWRICSSVSGVIFTHNPPDKWAVYSPTAAPE